MLLRENDKTDRNEVRTSHLQLVVGARLILTVVGHATGAALAAVKLRGDWIGYAAEFLLLFFKVLGGGIGSIGLNPVLGFLDGFEELVSC
jgi:hypothetical protein